MLNNEKSFSNMKKVRDSINFLIDPNHMGQRFKFGVTMKIINSEIKFTLRMDNLPLCIIVVGMAGSGKTSFVKRLTSHLHENDEIPFIVNLDPAVPETKFPTNIDICDSINYKDTMRDYNLGPNGGIVTCLNLYCTKFNQVIEGIHRVKDKHKYIIFDTPGQIEVFTWSASGNIITDLLSSSFPTVLVYMVDTIRCSNTTSFMTNMLYGSSILFKFTLPFLMIFNKVDMESSEIAIEWVKDFEKFLDATDKDTSYMSSFNRSLCLSISSFYEEIPHASLSCTTGEGIEIVISKLEDAKIEYHNEFKQRIDDIKSNLQHNKQRLEELNSTLEAVNLNSPKKDD
ncbi:GPN-loop GTPase 1 [Intoshia linei]|uniref:GPN-loop GTPase n=1 Tax=Intoshia linei TaxID=1819745 RepID=A0A177AZN6_9BILA|nr:GPN-loop GTPase 1 [Intoshia linei]